jgi:hypothetical protein
VNPISQQEPGILDRLRQAGNDYTIEWGNGDLYDEAADEIEHLRADLVSCRGTVKTELAHYERLAMVHGKTAVAANYEAEAQRLSDLLDRIDAIKDTP